MNGKGSVILGLISMLLVCACLVGVFSMAFTPEEDKPIDDTDQGTNNNTGGSNTGTSGGTTGGTNTGNTETVSKYQLYSHESYNSSRVGYRTIGTETWYFAVYENPLMNSGLDTALYDESTWSFTIIEDNVTIYKDMNVIIKYSFDYGISWNTAPLVADDSLQGKTIYSLSKIPSNKTVCISYSVVSNDKTPGATMQDLMSNVFTKGVYKLYVDDDGNEYYDYVHFSTEPGFKVTTANPALPDVIVPAG